MSVFVADDENYDSTDTKKENLHQGRIIIIIIIMIIARFI